MVGRLASALGLQKSVEPGQLTRRRQLLRWSEALGHLHQLLAPVGIPGAGNVLVRDRIAVWLHCGLGHRSMGQRTVGAHVRMKAVVKEGAEACMHSTITMSGPCPGYRASRRGRRTRVAKQRALRRRPDPDRSSTIARMAVMKHHTGRRRHRAASHSSDVQEIVCPHEAER